MINPETERDLEEMLHFLAENGEKKFFRRLRKIVRKDRKERYEAGMKKLFK